MMVVELQEFLYEFMRHTVEARIGDADENMADADTIERKLFLFQWRN